MQKIFNLHMEMPLSLTLSLQKIKIYVHHNIKYLLITSSSYKNLNILEQHKFSNLHLKVYFIFFLLEKSMNKHIILDVEALTSIINHAILKNLNQYLMLISLPFIQNLKNYFLILHYIIQSLLAFRSLQLDLSTFETT